MTDTTRAPLVPLGPRLVALGAAIREHRRGMSQRELARRIGVRQPTVSHWEAGHVDLPVERIRDLEVVLGVPHGLLLVEAGYVSRREQGASTAPAGKLA